MAESDKGTASSGKAKEKISVLDDDISKNFLGSWNTILGAESDDGSLDFKFEPVKGKKKQFNFDKLDMDFSLDGDFDKISSFKVDMGDLDFSSPAKTSRKSKETDLDFSSLPKEGKKLKERSEGESAKSNKGKKDCFAFSFDFNELDKFDLDAVLPTRTKELNKNDGNSRIKINSLDKHEDHGSKIQLADTDVRNADVPKAKSMLVKASNSKEEKATACRDEFDKLPETDPSKCSTLHDQIESKQSKLSSVRESTVQKSLETKTCGESYEESQLQNQSAENVRDKKQSKTVLLSSDGALTDHAQRTDKQSDQVANSCKQLYEMPKTQNQSAWSFTDKIGARDASELMQATSADDKPGDADSKMQALDANADLSLTLENENPSAKEMMPQHGGVHLKNLPDIELQGTDGEKNVPKSCNVLHGDMDTAIVAETVQHVKGSPVVDLSKPGTHIAESASGRQKKPTKITFSHVSRFNLKPTSKDKVPASAQALPSSNLVPLSRNAISSVHPSPSDARHSVHRGNLDKDSDLLTQEAIGGCIVSENTMKIVSDLSAREHSNAMEAQMKNNLGKISLPNDGKAAGTGTNFLGKPKQKEDTKSSSFQGQSSMLPNWTSKKNNQGSEQLKPKIPSFQSVRKLKMDTVVGKLSTLEVSKKMPNLSGLKISSSPALEDKIDIAKNLDNNRMNVTLKTAQLVGSRKPQSPAPSIKQQYPASSIKRKIAEVSDAAAAMSLPSKRLFGSQSSYRNAKKDSEWVAQEEVDSHNNILNCSVKGDSEKQPELTFEIPHEMKFADVGVTPVMENDETIEKAEAWRKELDQMCSMLRKKQEEAKELLVRVLVTNNRLLLLSNPMHALKLRQIRNFASRLISKDLPSKMC